MQIIDEILQYLHYHPASSRGEIMENISAVLSAATAKRLIADGINQGLIVSVGRGKATRYRITPRAHVLMTFNLDTLFVRNRTSVQ